MKIAFATLLIFLTVVGYLTLTEHTKAIRILHQDNLSMMILMRDTTDELHTIGKSIANAPIPMPFSRGLQTDPKVAQDFEFAPVNDQTPVRKPEIVK